MCIRNSEEVSGRYDVRFSNHYYYTQYEYPLPPSVLTAWRESYMQLFNTHPDWEQMGLSEKYLEEIHKPGDLVFLLRDPHNREIKGWASVSPRKTLLDMRDALRRSLMVNYGNLDGFDGYWDIVVRRLGLDNYSDGGEKYGVWHELAFVDRKLTNEERLGFIAYIVHTLNVSKVLKPIFWTTVFSKRRRCIFGGPCLSQMYKLTFGRSFSNQRVLFPVENNMIAVVNLDIGSLQESINSGPDRFKESEFNLKRNFLRLCDTLINFLYLKLRYNEKKNDS